MKKSINQMQDASSQNQQEEADSSKSTSIVNNVENTPFKTIETEKAGVCIIFGDTMVKTGFQSHEDAEEWINSKPWELILNAGAIYGMYINETNKAIKNEIINN